MRRRSDSLAIYSRISSSLQLRLNTYFFTFLLFNNFRCHDVHKHLPIVLPRLEPQCRKHQFVLLEGQRSQIAQHRHHIAVLILAAQLLKHQDPLVQHTVLG